MLSHSGRVHYIDSEIIKIKKYDIIVSFNHDNLLCLKRFKVGDWVKLYAKLENDSLKLIGSQSVMENLDEIL